MADYLTTSQAAKALGVDRRTILRWVKDGRFVGVIYTARKHARIPREAVEGFKGGPVNAGKALLYLRVGDEENHALMHAGLSHLVEYAQDRGYEIVRVVQEVGLGLDDVRPDLDTIRAEIQSGRPPYEIIVVESLDRLMLLGAEEFARWAKPFVRVEEAGPSSPEAERVYRREMLLDLYYPLCDALALRGLPPSRIERVVSEGLESIAEALGLFSTRPVSAW